MKTASAKAKGRRAVQELADMLLSYVSAIDPDCNLTDADFIVKGSGSTGEDLDLSTAARSFYPLCFEVKNQERLNIWSSLEQAFSHAEDTKRIPVVAFKRNGKDLHVALRLTDFLHLILGCETSTIS